MKAETYLLIKAESLLLALRWGVDHRAVETWMHNRGFTSVMDLKTFGGTHAESMEKAQADFWEFST